MRPIVYYVAVSLDGFIAHLNHDVDGFVEGGSGVEQYLSDLKQFDTVIMGRNTYEFGYRYGLQPGQRAYPHMRHYIFSNSLQLPEVDDLVHVKLVSASFVKELKAENGTPIYLCGGGQFAGWLLEQQLIDYLKIKLNPVILGKGIPLFGNNSTSLKTELLESKAYENGLQIMQYRILYK